MKICIDTLLVSRLKNIGVSNYSLEFLKSLLGSYPSPSYDFIWDSSKPIIDFGKNKKLSYINLYVDRINKDFTSIEEHLSNNKMDIYHSLNNGLSIPKNKHCAYIATVFNLLPAVNKDLVDDKYLNKFNTLFKPSIQQCDKIITLSESLKIELEELFQIDENKIEVIYPGCSKMFSPKPKDECEKILKENFNIHYPYMLYAGSIHKRKDLESTLSIFKEVIKEIKDLKFLIAGNISGKRKPYYLKLKELIKTFNLEDTVFFLGDVDYTLMPYLYSNAACTINLSKYEGFPLSTIEAIASGSPVVCNNIPVFKEVLANRGILIQSNNIASSTQSILDLITSRRYKASVINTQKDSLKKFDWNDSIRKTVRVYESFF